MTLFRWDENKAASNLHKHGIKFEAAIKVFEDDFVITERDRVIDGEWRWRSIGMVEGLTILLVAHTICESDRDEIIRIISARKATRHESTNYPERARHGK